MQLRDTELLDLLRGDPETGLKALMSQFGGIVYAVARRNLPQAEFCAADVEACTADVFSEFYLNLENYDPSKGSLKAWLCAIARYSAVDLARKSAPTLPLDEVTSAAAGGASPESNLEDRELRKAVLTEVKSLNEPDREILLRKYYLGESSKVIAARLGLTVSNVDTRTSRAVEKLRRALEEWRK